MGGSGGQGGAKLRMGMSCLFTLLVVGCPASHPPPPRGKAPGTLDLAPPWRLGPRPQCAATASETGGSVPGAGGGLLGSQPGAATGETCPHSPLRPPPLKPASHSSGKKMWNPGRSKVKWWRRVESQTGCLQRSCQAEREMVPLLGALPSRGSAVGRRRGAVPRGFLERGCRRD